MKKFIAILVLGILLTNNLFADHTNSHNIAISCSAGISMIPIKSGLYQRGHWADLGDVQIVFNKSMVKFAFMDGLKASLVKVQQKIYGQNVIRFFEKHYTKGEDSENFRDFLNNIRPVDFVYLVEGTAMNISEGDDRIIAVKDKRWKNWIGPELLSILINIDRINAHGTIVLRRESKKIDKIKYPKRKWFDSNLYYNKLEDIILSKCVLIEKQF